MLSYKSNPMAAFPAVGKDEVVRLSERDMKSLAAYAKDGRWPAAYLQSGHLDNCLVKLGFLKIESGEIAGESMEFVLITQAGRDYLAQQALRE